LAQYIFSQLKFNPADIARIIPQAAPSARAEALPPSPAADISAIVVREFFAKISQIGDIQIYIVVDPDRANLARELPLPVDLQLLRDAARQYGAIVIDPTPKFRDFVARTGLALEVGPYDRHWNSEAVRLVSTAVADAVATVK
jgi:hypothetical protein